MYYINCKRKFIQFTAITKFSNWCHTILPDLFCCIDVNKKCFNYDKLYSITASKLVDSVHFMQ